MQSMSNDRWWWWIWIGLKLMCVCWWQTSENIDWQFWVHQIPLYRWLCLYVCVWPFELNRVGVLRHDWSIAPATLNGNGQGPESAFLNRCRRHQEKKRQLVLWLGTFDYYCTIECPYNQPQWQNWGGGPNKNQYLFTFTISFSLLFNTFRSIESINSIHSPISMGTSLIVINGNSQHQWTLVQSIQFLEYQLLMKKKKFEW